MADSKESFERNQIDGKMLDCKIAKSLHVNWPGLDTCVCSVMSDSAIQRTVAYQAPLSMEFSRQEYWSGLPFPNPGDLFNLGIKPTSLESPVLVG